MTSKEIKVHSNCASVARIEPVDMNMLVFGVEQPVQQHYSIGDTLISNKLGQAHTRLSSRQYHKAVDFLVSARPQDALLMGVPGRSVSSDIAGVSYVSGICGPWRTPVMVGGGSPCSLGRTPSGRD